MMLTIKKKKGAPICKPVVNKETHTRPKTKSKNEVKIPKKPQRYVPIASINTIDFSITNPDDIRKMSVCEVKEGKIRDIDTSCVSKTTSEKIKTYANTLKDERMGTIERGENCVTCDETWDVCPGHFGHIELGRYMVHPLMAKILVKLLNCVCHKCASCYLLDGQLKLLPEIYHKEKMERMDAVFEYCKDIKGCKSERVVNNSVSGMNVDDDEESDDDVDYDAQCNEPRVHYWMDDINRIYYYFKKKDKSVEIYPHDIHRLLSAVTKEDCLKLGLNPSIRPEWMIIDVISVLPQCSRPYVMSRGTRHEDDLTYKYSDILKIIATLDKLDDEEKKGKNVTLKKNDQMKNLTYNITTLMNNSKNRAKQNSGKPYKGIEERITGKKGILRQNLRGKRVDFSARTVIAGDPSLKIDEMGIPAAIASTVSFPERVTSFNIHKLADLISQGKVNTVIKELPNGEKQQIMIEFAKEIKLDIGDIVERHIQDGDLTILNRQPTLHKQSMMAGRVKILPGSHFRIPLNVTTPFNADFDGDEMNAHFPQNEEVRSEMLNHMMVDKTLMSAQMNKPIMGLVQDSLVGWYILSQKEILIDDIDPDSDYRIQKPVEFFNIISILDWKDPMSKLKSLWKRCKKHGVHPYSGRALFSALLPEDFYYRRRTDANEEEPEVLIKNGVLITGVICKKSLGPSNASIHHYMFGEYGSRITCDFLSNLNFIANYWLTNVYGLSVGYKDCVPEDIEGLELSLTEIIAQAKIESINLGKTNYDNVRKELEINSVLNNAMEKSFICTKKHMLKNKKNDKLKPINEHNQLMLMPLCGSKGGMTNMCQIGALVGSQNIGGKRMPLTTGNFTRTLSCFSDSTTPESRGFVSSNFRKGMSPIEFFFHLTGSREGLINTAITTSVTGYFYRRISQSTEDYTVQYDGSVRDANNNIIEFAFGGNSLDPTQMITVNGKPSFADINHIIEKYNTEAETEEE